MAYVIGLLTPEDRKELERRGWKIEPCPKELIPEDIEDPDTMGMVWVDANMIDVMSGPNWTTGHDGAEGT